MSINLESQAWLTSLRHDHPICHVDKPDKLTSVAPILSRIGMTRGRMLASCIVSASPGVANLDRWDFEMKDEQPGWGSGTVRCQEDKKKEARQILYLLHYSCLPYSHAR